MFKDIENCQFYNDHDCSEPECNEILDDRLLPMYLCKNRPDCNYRKNCISNLKRAYNCIRVCWLAMGREKDLLAEFLTEHLSKMPDGLSKDPYYYQRETVMNIINYQHAAILSFNSKIKDIKSSLEYILSDQYTSEVVDEGGGTVKEFFYDDEEVIKSIREILKKVENK